METRFYLEPELSADTGRCECCGNVSRRTSGYAWLHDEPFAAYFVDWTVGHVPEYGANFDLIIGRWGKGARKADRYATSLVYHLVDGRMGFMVIDAGERAFATSPLVGRALKRNDVIGQPVSHDIFALCDALLAQDPRLAELAGMQS